MPDTLARLKAALADRYTLQRELGRGGMATVYLAEDLKHHRPVALKVLRPELAAALGPDRFLREIELAARLTHPHILPLHDSGNADGFLYYVMPYVEGESLRDRLTRETQLPVDDALQISREVADALSYAHSHGVIHRDIKPENILLESGHAVVADFGIAKAVDAAGGGRLTETGVAMGTPAYMSPEQAGGSRELDGRSDLYSLGCVLYEMLAGGPPFKGPTVESLVRQHLSAEPPNITSIRPSVPSWVVSALQRALAKTPADRFNPVALFAEALGSGESGATVPHSTWAAAPVPARIAWHGRPIWAIATVVAVAVLGIVASRQLGRRASDSVTTPRVVVLPFANVGAPEDEYFADGITEEITARLAGLPSLSVISRQSAMQYKASPKSLKEIGKELDAQYVLEGSIRWSRGAAGNRVRVTPQLIVVADDSHLWAEVFDEDLTEVFAVQSAIATRVAEALGVALDPSATRELAKTPTSNLEAYDYYLRAKEYDDRSYGASALQVAANLYRRAADLDPRFAEAFAMVAYEHLNIYWFGYDRSPTRLESAKRAADSALALSTNGAEGHMALGYYFYWGYRDYENALRHFELAHARRPNDPEVAQGFASVYRRQGRMQEARNAFERWVTLDPRSATAAYNLAETCHLLRDFAAAQRELERAIALQPEFSWPPFELVSVFLGQGDTARARQAAMTASAREAPPGWPQRYWWFTSAASRILGEDYLAALRRVYGGEFGGDTAADLIARGSFAEARTVLEAAALRSPNETRIQGQLAATYLGLGMPASAVRAARRAVELMPLARDAYDGAEPLANLAQVLALTGDPGGAVEQLELLLTRPGRLTSAWLRLDPVWDPIRADPRFQALLTKYDPQQPVR
jgi:serine/threonine-protein kinase